MLKEITIVLVVLAIPFLGFLAYMVVELYNPGFWLLFQLHPSTWRTYTNTAYGYSLQYPNDKHWPVDYQKGDGEEHLDPTSNDLSIQGKISESWDHPSGEYLRIAVCENPTDAAIDEWFRSISHIAEYSDGTQTKVGVVLPCGGNTQNVQSPEEIIQTFQKISIAGKPAVRFTDQQKGTPVIYIAHNKHIYAVHAFQRASLERWRWLKKNRGDDDPNNSISLTHRITHLNRFKLLNSPLQNFYFSTT